MDQPLSGHVVALLPEHGYAILLLEDAREIAVSRECLADGTLAGLHVGDRVWYFEKPGRPAHQAHRTPRPGPRPQPRDLMPARLDGPARE